MTKFAIILEYADGCCQEMSLMFGTQAEAETVARTKYADVCAEGQRIVVVQKVYVEVMSLQSEGVGK